ncbi:hypothetical protein SLA2020_226320 [Shorea laevis]
MVFADEKKNFIHAIIWSSNILRFKNKLVEGNVYYVKNFSMEKNKDAYRVVSHNNYKIQFHLDTIVKEIIEEVAEIPRFVFELTDYEKLLEKRKKCLCDVIGVLVGVGTLQERQANGTNVTCMELHIEDQRKNRLNVTLWSSMVNQFEQIRFSNYSNVEVIIFTSMIVKDNRGGVSLSSSQSTKIYMDDNIVEIADFKGSIE